MDRQTNSAALEDDLEWAERSEFWIAESRPKKRRGNPKPERRPLILTGHGVRLRVQKGALLVSNGYTHYPQRKEELQLFQGDWRLPTRIIVLDTKGVISFDALSWLNEQNIPLIQINWSEVTTVAGGGSGFSADPKLVKRQLEIRENGEWVGFIAGLIEEKIRNSISTLEKAFPKSPAIQLAISKLEKDAKLVSKNPPKTIDGFLGIEGRVASHYFRCWNSFPLKWKNTGKHPIPEDWKGIGSRKSVFKKKGSNKRAVHPVNAMLNYAYAILESQVKIQVVAQGLDPTIGYLHADRSGRPALVLDVMEPLRPVVDLAVLEFVQMNKFEPEDFPIRSDGVCRLNPNLATRIATLISTSALLTVGSSQQRKVDVLRTEWLIRNILGACTHRGGLASKGR